MKLNWHLVKTILDSIENDNFKQIKEKHGINEETSRHISLLTEAGYISSEMMLTAKGYDLLSVIRSEQIWDIVIQSVTKLNTWLSFSILEQLIPIVIKVKIQELFRY